MNKIKLLWAGIGLVFVGILLSGCGDSGQPTREFYPATLITNRSNSDTKTVSSLPVTPGPKLSVTTGLAGGANPSGAPTNIQKTTLAEATDLTIPRANKDEVVRTFTDGQKRPIRLTYGRGSGHGGDYGWAHILGKHVNGIWYDGGTITTFPQALGAKTPEAVVDLIGKSLQDSSPNDSGGGRRSYVYAVPGTNRDVFTVVGNDGTIITSYPVPHGSKDEG